jgi:prepilin-type N-terminal cleavage/methylation domain-containing protein
MVTRRCGGVTLVSRKRFSVTADAMAGVVPRGGVPLWLRGRNASRPGPRGCKDLSTKDSMKRRANSSNRSGFTLAEILVTVTIIAVLAAVVVPSIGGTLFKGDVGRATSDLTNLRGGMEQFLTDTRRYPGALVDLSTAISTTGTGGDAVLYDASAVSRWKGPYMNTKGSTTGFGGTITGPFVRVDCTTALTTSITTPCLAVIVTGIRIADARRIALAMSGDSTTVTLAGNVLRFFAGTPGSTPDTVKYLALPMQ